MGGKGARNGPLSFSMTKDRGMIKNQGKERGIREEGKDYFVVKSGCQRIMQSKK